MVTTGVTIEERETMAAIQSINHKIPELELRDLFAMSALKSIIEVSNGYFYGANAETAYKYADAMLNARSKK